MNRRYRDTGELPVLVLPLSIEFFTVDRDSHKQTLTIYNPYGFNVRYKGNDVEVAVREPTCTGKSVVGVGATFRPNCLSPSP